MKKVAVIGLGIIGGSVSGALTSAGYSVDGFDINEKNVRYAQETGYIQGIAEDTAQYDVVFLAIPPKATMQYLREGAFKNGALVMDVCGVKQAPERAVAEKDRAYRYVGLHPMAGKETSGIQSASPTLFQRANIVVTVNASTSQESLDEALEYVQEMGFGNIVLCSAEEHDRKIALTSQLAHIVSNAYVKSEQVRECDGFTGGSFQDMTRIAGVDETIWTQLYFCNREYILEELKGLIQELNVYKEALENEDSQALSDALKEGRLIRQKIKRPND